MGSGSGGSGRAPRQPPPPEQPLALGEGTGVGGEASRACRRGGAAPRACGSVRCARGGIGDAAALDAQLGGCRGPGRGAGFHGHKERKERERESSPPALRHGACMWAATLALSLGRLCLQQRLWSHTHLADWHFGFTFSTLGCWRGVYLGRVNSYRREEIAAAEDREDESNIVVLLPSDWSRSMPPSW